jgi:hypothetical protein
MIDHTASKRNSKIAAELSARVIERIFSSSNDSLDDAGPFSTNF